MMTPGELARVFELMSYQGVAQVFIERPRLTKLLDEARARIILLLAPAGYAVFSINYRLAPKYSYPYMVYDVERAVLRFDLRE